MIPQLQDYEKIVGKEKIDHLRQSSNHLRGKHVVHINSTSMGGGVAEILNTLVFLMNDLGIDTGWRILLGSQSFFKITKGIHNSLQGKKWKFTPHRKKIYFDYCKRNSIINHISEHDIVVIHDPQPLGMVEQFHDRQNWIWRCHIDISHPYKKTMDQLVPLASQYDAMIVSSKNFMVKKIKTPQYIINPSIDPLARKNMKISMNKARRVLSSEGIDLDKPIISQISRFDPWKDHKGVIKMYEKIKEKTDCQLILMGNMASDDPEGHIIFHKVKQQSEKIPDLKIITDGSDLVVNALQTASSFIFQNSIKEGFALTVSESMWKRTPVIGTYAGGIPLQIRDGKTGYLIRSRADGIKRGIALLEDDSLRKKLGDEGHNHVKENFLITRHLQDYIDLFNKFYPPPVLGNNS